MRTFVTKPNTSQPAMSATASPAGRARAAQGHDPDPAGALAPPRFGHAFGRIAVAPRAVGTMQAKLAVNAPGDAYEQEADRVAERVMRMPAEPKPRRPCACGGGCPRCRTDDRRRVQTKRVDPAGSGPAVAPPIVEDALATGGGPLPAGLRADMERRFGHDFGRVRLHVDARAAAAAAAVGARAYTVGPDVAFAAGEYAPNTDAGRRLIAHELAHVLQQGAAPAPMLQRDSGGPGGKKEETPIERVPYGDKAPAPAGETKSEEGEGEAEEGPKLTLASAARPACDPKGFSRKDYLAQPHTSEDDFGLTRFAGKVTMALTTRKVKGGVMLEPLKVALPAITSVFTQADTFIEGTAVVLGQDGADCPGGKVPLQWTIFAPGAAKIREGEMEHCEDLQYAYDVSLGWYAQVVDGLIAKGRKFASEAAAFKHLEKVTGTHPTGWLSVFECLAKKTELRDGRKFSNGWHTPRVKPRPPTLNDGCKFARVFVTGAANFPELGKHPTPDVIKGCGESPEAVKSLAAKAAAAKAAAGEAQAEGKPGDPAPKTPEPPKP